VGSILSSLDPLEHYCRLLTLMNSSFLTSIQSDQLHQQALVAAADLRVTYKAADMSRFPKLRVSNMFYMLLMIQNSPW
jgi:hypothetical protein